MNGYSLESRLDAARFCNARAGDWESGEPARGDLRRSMKRAGLSADAALLAECALIMASGTDPPEGIGANAIDWLEAEAKIREGWSPS